VIRRSFFSVLAANLATPAVALLVPVFSRAAAPAKTVSHIGLVLPGAYSRTTHGANAFWERLRKLGWTEGQNFVLEGAGAEAGSICFPASWRGLSTAR